jgi:hypothetical protein
VALPPDDDAIQRIEVAEERVRVTTRPVAHGAVQVHLTTEEVEETVRATLRGRRATVERVPMDRELTEAPAVRQEGDVVVVPVVEEILVVERRLRLREEIHLRLEHAEEEVAVPVLRRVQHAEIRQVPETATPTNAEAPAPVNTDPSTTE